MKPISYILIAAWILIIIQTVVYSRFKLRGKGRTYTISKCAGSLIFTLTALSGVIFVESLFGVLMLTGFVFSFAGDYFLSKQSGTGFLKAGIVAFQTAHLVFICTFFLFGGFFWWQGALLLISVSVFPIIEKCASLSFLGQRKLVYSYTVVVSVMVTAALSLPFAGKLSTPAAWLTATGAVLFYISDLLWAIYGFSPGKKYRVLKVMNVFLYFFGQMLMATGVSAIGG
ncbi:MAG: lysoplasmalogenase [Oscillospiraceae bacterium]|jgi:uncharacterized membrane protein YhhN|nr:lysoplasmalogenase [Oscillospiraceae bacterium]